MRTIVLCVFICTLALVVIITVDFIILSNQVDKLRPECQGQTSSINAEGKKHTEWFPRGCRHG